MLTGGIISTDRAQTLIRRRSSGRGRGDLAVHQLVSVGKLEGVGKGKPRLFPDGTGDGEGLAVQTPVRSRAVVAHGDVQGTVKAHLATRHGRAGWRLLEREQG